jgi:hypothetical protein
MITEGKFTVPDVPKGKVQIAFFLDKKLAMESWQQQQLGDPKKEAEMKKKVAGNKPADVKEEMPDGISPKKFVFTNNVPTKYSDFGSAQLTREVEANKENNFDFTLTN